MKRMEDSMQNPNSAQNNENSPEAISNKKRVPTNVKHDLFNANALLKQVMKDCIDEGM